jgi:Pentapeptide repeats (9 copies)
VADLDDLVPIDWEPCDHNGCIGVRVAPYSGCLAHASDADRDTALTQLSAYGNIDARGLRITAALLGQIYAAAPKEGEIAKFGKAQFTRAIFEVAPFDRVIFERDADFNGVTFEGNAWFGQAEFRGDASFEDATFQGKAWFGSARRSSGGSGFVIVSPGATFRDNASFARATFRGDGWFSRAVFECRASFPGTTFAADALFSDVTFNGDSEFGGATFKHRGDFSRAIFSAVKPTFYGDASFVDATFEQERQLGPLLVRQWLLLDGVRFAHSAQIEAAASGVACCRAQFPDGVQLRLRHARVLLDDSDFAAPSLLTGGPVNARLAKREEEMFGTTSELPQLLSLQQANVAGLGLSNVSLADCRYNGAHNLDMLRMDADVAFGLSPGRLGWERRQVIAEEAEWRAGKARSGRQSAQSGQWTAPGWPDRIGNEQREPPKTLDAGTIANLYRALRKGREDAKNEPGAADFYYGEMEMRRHARTTPPVERAIIWLYWLISGYGLRALRSLAALVILGVIVTTALTGWGLAATALVTAPPQQLAGTVTTTPHKPARINATLRGVSPGLPPSNQRWTRERTGTAVEVALESFAFRSTDQPLTTAGVWATTAARILGPVLLALTLLAVRNRVKR